MSKLYIFGIGGTGARVIRSLTMLLASGVRIEADEVVPIIVDVDLTNGNTVQSEETLKWYQKIRSRVQPESEFFTTPMRTIGQITGADPTAMFRFSFDSTHQKKFRDFIDYSKLSAEDQFMVNLLYSEEYLDDELTEGFKGKPNMGSVALNTLTSMDEYDQFVNSFQPGDRIFVVSSIFGGTGAAGFPILLKNFCSQKSDPKLQKALKGALTVMPYFGVQADNESQIDSNTFHAKTKAALAYYEKNLSGLHHLYYLADTIKELYPNFEGSTGQRNKAHVIEVLGALAIIDFARQTFETSGAKTLCHEFALKEDGEVLTFTNLPDPAQALIKAPLIRFLYLYYIMQFLLRSERKDAWIKNIFGTASALNDEDAKLLQKFLYMYADWITELAENKRAFEPFYMQQFAESFAHALVKGYQLEPGGLFRTGLDDNFIISALGSNSRQLPATLTTMGKLIKAGYAATDAVIQRFYK
ncbi:MAG TPA: hypothetical protein PLG25_15015 [bacterium]|nr:hypothetical protein [bacterium]HMW34754.1 hypothetical protein [bacterium]HMY36131.1 hypothetical protein [bacterium]HMZ03546.1 hypothetical protein [bacterium]HNB09380.1 hypothetical protein [bacterium]